MQATLSLTFKTQSVAVIFLISKIYSFITIPLRVSKSEIPVAVLGTLHAFLSFFRSALTHNPSFFSPAQDQVGIPFFQDLCPVRV